MGATTMTTTTTTITEEPEELKGQTSEVSISKVLPEGPITTQTAPFSLLQTIPTNTSHRTTPALHAAPTQIDNESLRPSPPPTPRVFNVAPSNGGTRARKLLLTTLIISANLVQMISNIITIAAGLTIATSLNIPATPSQSTWIAAAYPLTQGTFVLISGRLGSVYGHKRVLLAGGTWFAAMSLATGFCDSYVAFTAVRALTGVGGALIMPNAVAMLNTTVPPGRGRNLAVAAFAASAPVGGWLGALLAALITPWQGVFWFLAGLAALVVGLLVVLLPPETPVDRGGKIDYVGAGLGVAGLILFNFVWNQAPSVGWAVPYQIVILVASVVMLGLFVVWEKWFAAEPIMPLGIFKAPSFSALILVVLLSFMSFSISLWYMISWLRLLRDWTLLDIAVGWIPFGVGATASAGLAAWLIPRLPAQWIVAIGALAVGISNLLLATMPEHQTYWANTFVAIVVGSFCPDLVYTAAQIIASNSVNRRQQGTAASLIGTLNLYGNSLGLGFAGTIETEIHANEPPGTSMAVGFRASLFFGVGIAVAAAVLDAWLVRMPKDEREGWADEDDNDPTDEVVLSSSVAIQPVPNTVTPRVH